MTRGSKQRFVVLAAGILVFVTVALAWESIWSWIRCQYLFAYVGENAHGQREYRHRQTGAVFVRLPGGRPSRRRWRRIPSAAKAIWR